MFENGIHDIQVTDSAPQPADARPREVIEVITTLDPLTVPAQVDLQPAVVVQTEPAQPAPVATSPVDPAPGAVDVTPAVSAPADQAPADSTPAAAPAVTPPVPADPPSVTPVDQPAPVQPAPAVNPAPAAEAVPSAAPSTVPPTEQPPAVPSPVVDPPAPVQPVPEPTVGRLVHFFLDNGEARPAMVISVQDGIYTDLQVFTNGEADKSLIPERVIMLNANNGVEHPQVPGLVHRAQVLMGTEPGQWSWPARS